MDASAFLEHARTAGEPPAGTPPAAAALWWAAHGDWHRAHDLCQSCASRDGDWVHAHLHREEGDDANAAYWYRRAGRAVSAAPLAEERLAIATALLGS